MHLNNHIELLKTLHLDNFPSGSSMEYYKERFYLIGDDATKMLVLDKDYNCIDAINLFTNTLYRIPKKEKTDLEASAIIHYKECPHLLILGSASKEKRAKIILVSLEKKDAYTFEIIETETFIKHLAKEGIEEVNIEGAAAIHDVLILSNRGNKLHPDNFLIITKTDFFAHQNKPEINTSKVDIDNDGVTAGLSGLAYSKDKDILFFTASTESTLNAVDDGEIGDSYLGLIRHMSSKLHEKIIKPDLFINLSKMNTVFNKEKIESVCIEETVHKDLIIHLVSDNDNGTTGLFKIKLHL